MKIVFIHYHIKPGGVTTVLKHQVQAVAAAGGDALIVTGEAPPGPFPADVCVIEGLGYDTLPGVKPPAAQVADRIVRAINNRWDTGCDLAHVHNPTLAKNGQFLKVLRILQEKSLRLFLQIHDFAEDGRPTAWFSGAYPAGCHYGVINARDYDLMKKAGWHDNGLHLIANTITPLGCNPDDGPGDNRVLYPIRAIRRKNIGEAILLSCFFKHRETLAITLPPNSPSDIAAYKDWKAFTRARRLPVAYEMGIDHDFRKLVAGARFLMTTSITEGFGFSFLEPWTAGKFLWGRLLPDICRDFEAQGIELSHLYHQLAVPLDWIDRQALMDTFTRCIRQAADRFDNIVDPAPVAEDLADNLRTGTIDFGLLNESYQRQIIARVVARPEAAAALSALNPFLASPGEVADKTELIRRNKARVLSRYNPTTYQETLVDIYNQVRRTEVRHQPDKARLLKLFLTPENLSLLKWGDYESDQS